MAEKEKTDKARPTFFASMKGVLIPSSFGTNAKKAVEMLQSGKADAIEVYLADKKVSK